MRREISCLLLLPALALTACMESPRDQLAGDTPPQTVGTVDLDRYAGLWFEIFRADHSFERDCDGVTAFYERQGEDRVRVINRCWKGGIEGELDIANGRARLPDPSDTSRLEVSFFGPFYGDYWVIDLAEDYSWALVSEPAGRYLWMLSRTPRPDPALSEARLQSLRDRGFDTDGLIFPEQWESVAAMPREGLPDAER